MAQSIVVPLLDSVFSTRALPVLVALADRCEAELHLLDLRPPAPGEAEPSGPRLLQEARVRSIREAYCAHIASQAAERTGPGRVRSSSREGDAARELVRYAVQQDAALVTLVLENREMAGEAASRGLATEIAAGSGVPVLLLISRADGTREVALVGALPDGLSRSDLYAIADPASGAMEDPPLIGA